MSGWPVTYEEWMGEDINGPPEGLFADDDMHNMLSDHEDNMLLHLAIAVCNCKLHKKCIFAKYIKTAPISMHQSNMC